MSQEEIELEPEDDENVIEAEYRVLGESTIIHDDFDRRVFTKAITTMPNFQRLGGEVALKTGEFVASSLVQDVFYLFYKKVPMQPERSEVKASRQINYSITRELIENPAWKDVRSSGTPGDWYYSALATMHTLRCILPTLKDADLQDAQNLERWERQLETLMQHQENLDDIIAESERRLKEEQDSEEGEESEEGDDFDWDISEDDEDDEDENDSDELIEEEARDTSAGREPVDPEKVEELKKRKEVMAEQLKEAIEAFKELSFDSSPENPMSKIDYEKIESETAQMAVTALRESEKEIDQAEDNLKAFGGMAVLTPLGGATGSDVQEDISTIDAKMKIAEAVKYNYKLNIIAKIAGRMFRIANRVQESKARGSRLVVTGITRGDDLQNVLPMEMTKLDNPELKMLFLADFAEKNLLQYKRENKDKQGRGPIIFALDNSSSMGWQAGSGLEGTREQWSKGVLLALLGIANKQQRDFVIVNFSDKSAGRRYNPKITRFNKGKGTPQEILDALVFFSGGGTNYQDWIDEAKTILKETTMSKADVILVSDGEAEIDEKEIEGWNLLRKEKEVRCYSVMIGYSALNPGSAVMKISDEVIFLNDKNDESTVTSKLFGV